MDKLQFLKKHFIIIFYVVSLIVVTGYLHFENSKEKVVSTTNVTKEFVPEIQSEAAPEVSEETAVVVEEEPVEQFIDDGSEFLENRPNHFETNVKEIASHQLIAENDSLRLFLNDETLSIIIQDAINGSVIYSTVEKPVKSNPKWESFVKSAVVIEYLIDNNIVYNQVDMVQGEPEVKLALEDKGFTANIYYPELEIGFDINVKIEKNQLLVEVPKESIIENSDHYKIGNMYVYPMLGYAKNAEVEGFMFIPDGSGATIRLADNNGRYSQPYSEMVYGSNLGLEDPYVLSELYGMVTTDKPYDILFPVFGMMHESKKFGFVGIIEEGDVHSRIEAYPSGAILPYNWITGKYVFRQFYTQATSQSSGTITQRQKNRNDISIKVRYSFIENEKADLFGMIASYRDYIMEKYQLVSQDSELTMRLDFLGNDIEKGLVKDQPVVMSTFEEIGQAIENLTELGVINKFIGLHGWQEDGETGSTSSDTYQVSKLLGGTNGLLSLIEQVKNQGDIYLHDHPLRYNAPKLGIASDTLNKINRKPFKEDVGGKVIRDYQYLPPETAVKRLYNRMENFDQQINFMLSGIGQHIFSYYKDSKDYDRVHTLSIFEEAIATISKDKSLVLNQPIQPYWQYLNSMVNVPLSSSGYVFEDESVPFLPLALRGILPLYSEYLNFESNSEEFFLKLVETGVNPSYFLTINNPSLLHNTNYSNVYTSKMTDYQEAIADMYQVLSELSHKVKDSEIIGYSKSKGIAKISYENKLTLYINYNNGEGMMDGIKLEAKSYKVVE